jgi:hypothetical protein
VGATRRRCSRRRRLATRLAPAAGRAPRLALGRTRFDARSARRGSRRTACRVGGTAGRDARSGRRAYAAPSLDVASARRGSRCANCASRSPSAAPEASAGFALAPTSLRALLVTLGIEPPVTTDPRALGEFALDGRVCSSPRAGCGSSRLTWLLDETRLAGRIERGGEPPLARVHAGRQHHDLDRYLEPEGTPGEPFRFPARRSARCARAAR